VILMAIRQPDAPRSRPLRKIVMGLLTQIHGGLAGSGRAGAARLALLAAASFGAFDHATLAFLPRFGTVYGLSAAAMGIGLSVLNVGNVLLQPPIGWASDRWGRRPVLVSCALLTVLGGGLLPWLIKLPLVYLFLFVWGACAYGVTTVALARHQRPVQRGTIAQLQRRHDDGRRLRRRHRAAGDRFLAGDAGNERVPSRNRFHLRSAGRTDAHLERS
jgi:hypothetical protein